MLIEYLLFILLGLGGAVLNTVVGGGAGLIFVPVLILAFDLSANGAIATGFTAVAIGAITSTLAYYRQGRVDFKAGALMAALTIPGVISGAFMTASIDPFIFELILGSVIVFLGVMLYLSPRLTRKKPIRKGWSRKLVDSYGKDFSYTVNRRLSLMAAVITGFFGGTFGAGGGLILTPALVFSGFPIHVALGTIRLVAIALAAGSSLTRFSLGQVETDIAFWLIVGAVPGAILGARIARLTESGSLTKLISSAIVLMGVILIIEPFLR